jgi:hypothetical protein
MKQDKTIIFKIYNTILEASFAQNKLKEHGIDSFLEEENVIGINPLGGFELKLYSHDKEKAETILLIQH